MYSLLNCWTATTPVLSCTVGFSLIQIVSGYVRPVICSQRGRMEENCGGNIWQQERSFPSGPFSRSCFCDGHRRFRSFLEFRRLLRSVSIDMTKRVYLSGTWMTDEELSRMRWERNDFLVSFYLKGKQREDIWWSVAAGCRASRDAEHHFICVGILCRSAWSNNQWLSVLPSSGEPRALWGLFSWIRQTNVKERILRLQAATGYFWRACFTHRKWCISDVCLQPLRKKVLPLPSPLKLTVQLWWFIWRRRELFRARTGLLRHQLLFKAALIFHMLMRRVLPNTTPLVAVDLSR